VSNKHSPVASAAGAHEAASAFGSSVGEVWKAMQGLSLPLPALTQVQSEYIEQATDLWNQSLQRLQAPARSKEDKPAAKATSIGDRRFAAQDWIDNPGAAYMAQMYLLNARTLLQLAEQVQGDEKTRARLSRRPSAGLTRSPSATKGCCRSSTPKARSRTSDGRSSASGRMDKAASFCGSSRRRKSKAWRC